MPSRKAPADPSAPQLRQAVQSRAEQWPIYGYRRIAAMRERADLPGGPKLVRRLMAELGLAARAPKRKVRTTNSQHGLARYPNLVMGLVVSRPEQGWVCDFSDVRLQREFV